MESEARYMCLRITLLVIRTVATTTAMLNRWSRRKLFWFRKKVYRYAQCRQFPDSSDDNKCTLIKQLSKRRLVH